MGYMKSVYSLPFNKTVETGPFFLSFGQYYRPLLTEKVSPLPTPYSKLFSKMELEFERFFETPKMFFLIDILPRN